MWTQSVLGKYYYTYILYVEDFAENIVYPLLCPFYVVRVVCVNARVEMRVIYCIYNIICRRFYGKYYTLRAMCGFILYLYYIYTIICTSCTLKRRQLNRYCALRNAHGAAVVVGGKGMEAVIYK